MPLDFGHPHRVGGGALDQLEQSLVVDDGDSSEMTKKFGTTGDGAEKQFTYSIWWKRCNVGATQNFLGYVSGAFNDLIEINSDDTFEFVVIQTSIRARLITDRKFTDTHVYNHTMIVWDSANGTSGDRAQMWINGVRITDFSTETYPALNETCKLGSNVENDFLAINAGAFADGNVAEVIMLDGYAATDATDFGYFNADNGGNWEYKTPTGLSYGTNGYHLKFDDADALGKDNQSDGTYANGTDGWTGSSGFANIVGNGINSNASLRAMYRTTGFAGDFVVRFIYHEDDGQAGGVVVGVFDTAETGTFATTGDSDGNMGSMTNSWWLRFNDDDCRYGGVNQQSLTAAEGDSFELSRSGSTFTVKQNGVTVHTYSQTSSATVHLAVGMSTTNCEAQCLRWKDGSTSMSGNDWRVKNIDSTNQSKCSPSENYAKWSITDVRSISGAAIGSIEKGGMNFRGLSGNAGVVTSLSMRVGWHTRTYQFEAENYDNIRVGICAEPYRFSGSDVGSDTTGWSAGWRVNNGNAQWKYQNSSANIGVDITGVITMTLDMSTNTNNLKIYEDGTLRDTRSVDLLGMSWKFLVRDESGSIVRDLDANFGQNDFQHPVSGAYALSGKNLYDDMIANGGVADPTKYVDFVKYTGDGTAIGSGGLKISADFQPGFAHFFNFDANDNHLVFDHAGGVEAYHTSNNNNIEVTGATETVSSFDADGLTVGDDVQVNTSGEEYGVLLVKAEANLFWGVNYAGPSGAGNVAHGHSVAPGFWGVFVRDGTARSRTFCHEGLADDYETDYIFLDTSGNGVDDATSWDDTAPDGTNVRHGTSARVGGSQNYRLHSHVEKVGVTVQSFYEGNATSTLGRGIDACGLPTCSIIKGVTGSSAWIVFPHAFNIANGGRVSTDFALIDSSTAQTPTAYVEFCGTGLKTWSNHARFNGNGVRYICQHFLKDNRQRIGW